MIKQINIHNYTKYYIYSYTLLQQKMKNILPNLLLFENIMFEIPLHSCVLLSYYRMRLQVNVRLYSDINMEKSDKITKNTLKTSDFRL